MKKLPIVINLLALISILTITEPLEAAQKVAIPSYFYPGGYYWMQLENSAPTVGLAIINPNSGPGRRSDKNYVNEVQRAKAKGILVLGYVYTSYGSRSTNNVKSDIDKYYTWYGVDGIFLDEASTNCSKQSYYNNLYTYVKAKGGPAKVVINPGSNTNECYISVADVIVNFENVYSVYFNWQPSGWEYKYSADHFWHLVYNTRAASMPSAIALSKSKQAGWVYVTPDKLPNPWDTLPPDSYWIDELFFVNQ